MNAVKLYRQRVLDTAQKLDTIADKLTRRAALHQASLSPIRADEWAGELRAAEVLLTQYADSLLRDLVLRRVS